MRNEMNPEIRKTGSMLKAAIRQRVGEGQPIADVLGHYYHASDWLDLEAEGSAMRQDTTWYVSTDGDLLYEETESGRRFYHCTLDPALVYPIHMVA